MSMAENLKDAAKADRGHFQESMKTISIMAPKHYEFDPRRPGHAFEMEVSFPHTGSRGNVRFESMTPHFQNLPRVVDPADYFGNIGRTLFLVPLYPEPPMEQQAWPELFVPAGIGENLKNTAEYMDYNLRGFSRDLGPNSTVMDAIAYHVEKTKESATWLFNPLLSLDEALIHLGFREAPSSEPKEERREARRDACNGRYSGIASLLFRAADQDNRGSRASHPMNRQTDQVGYFYARSQLPVCPQVRALLNMPASTIPHYLDI